jgi:hypothetical protein
VRIAEDFDAGRTRVVSVEMNHAGRLEGVGRRFPLCVVRRGAAQPVVRGLSYVAGDVLVCLERLDAPPDATDPPAPARGARDT